MTGEWKVVMTIWIVASFLVGIVAGAKMSEIEEVCVQFSPSTGECVKETTIDNLIEEERNRNG